MKASVTLDSVLFGRKAEQLSKISLVAIRSQQPGGGFSVGTRDGSIYRCTAIKVADGELTAMGGLTGTLTVKAEELVEVTRSDP